MAGMEALGRVCNLIPIAAGKPFDYQGASGPCDFDSRGDVVAQLARFQVRGGRFVDVERFDCLRDPSCPQVHERCVTIEPLLYDVRGVKSRCHLSGEGDGS